VAYVLHDGGGGKRAASRHYTLAFASQKRKIIAKVRQQINVPETNHSVNLAALLWVALDVLQPSGHFFDFRQPLAQVLSKLPTHRVPHIR
jgi:hypothetical protein